MPNAVRPWLPAVLIGALLLPTVVAAQSAGTTLPLRGRNAAAVPDQGSWERREIRDAGGPLDPATASGITRQGKSRGHQARHSAGRTGLPVAQALQP